MYVPWDGTNFAQIISQNSFSAPYQTAYLVVWLYRPLQNHLPLVSH